MSDDQLTERIALLGGEMLVWSDLDRATGHGPYASPLSVPLLTDLLTPATRALVVGPHAPWLLESFADSVGLLDIVVRSWPDAHALNLRLNGKPVRIFCGAFEKFPEQADSYDVVLALDGIDRLFAPDGIDMRWPDAVATLRGLLRPGGRLVLGVDNTIGLDTLLDADASVRPPTDDQWPTTLAADTACPPGLDAVRAGLRDCELDVESCYALFPRPEKTSLMVRDSVLVEHPRDEVLTILTSAAFADGMGDHPVLTDPRRLARDVAEHGLALPLASGWLFVTTAAGDPAAGGSGADGKDAASAAGRAAVLVTDNLDHPYWATVQSLTHEHASGSDDTGWVRTLVDVGRSTSERASGYLRRRPRLLEGPVPTGTLLEEQFLTACRHDDLLALRQLTTSYASWLQSLAELKPWRDPWAAELAEPTERLVLPGPAVFATFENVVASPLADLAADSGKPTDPGHTLLDPSWDTSLAVPYEIALTRVLRRFGYRLLAGGLRHPWPSGMSPNRLTVTLASMVGVTVGASLLERATRLEVELAGQQRNNTETGDQQLYYQLQTMGEQPMGTEPGQPRGYREALATVGRLSTELQEAQSQIEWLDKTVQLREDQLYKARKMATDIKSSVSFGVGRAVTRPGRNVFRLLRPIFRNLTPPSKT